MEHKYEIPFTERGNAFPGSVTGEMIYVNQPNRIHNNCTTSAVQENEDIYVVPRPVAGNTNNNNKAIEKKDCCIKATLVCVLSVFSALLAVTGVLLALYYLSQEEDKAQLDKLQGDYQTLSENYSMLLASFSKEKQITEERLNSLTLDYSMLLASFSKEKLITEERLNNLTFVEPGWYIPGKYYQYLLSNTRMNWEQSRRWCQSRGGDLATAGMRDDTLRRTIVDSYLGTELTWIGLSDLATEGTFVWVDGVTATTENAGWSPGEPNDVGNNEDCVHIILIGTYRYTLNDYPCEQSNGRALCEKSLFQN